MREISAEIDKSTSDCDRDKLEESLAKASSGVAAIRVRAPTEAGMKSRKEALGDACRGRQLEQRHRQDIHRRAS